jgi:hypothetical protein
VVTSNRLELKALSSNPIVVEVLFIFPCSSSPFPSSKYFIFLIFFYLKISHVFSRKNTCKNAYNRNPVKVMLSIIMSYCIQFVLLVIDAQYV